MSVGGYRNDDVLGPHTPTEVLIYNPLADEWKTTNIHFYYGFNNAP